MSTTPLRYFASGLAGPPPLGRPLWGLLAASAFSCLNLAFEAELWPHTPGAARVLGLATGLAALLALPLLLRWAGRWLRACAGPWWLLLPLKIAFVASWLPLGLGWLAGLAGWVIACINSRF